MLLKPGLKDTLPKRLLPMLRNTQTTPFSIGMKLRMNLWEFVQATLFRWSPTRLRGFRRGLLRLFGAQIDDTASISRLAKIDCPWNLIMGAHASIGEHAWVYCLDRIVLGEYACIGQHARLLTGTHDYRELTFPLVTEPIIVCYGCWIAVGATVLPGVVVGAGTVVGAGAVVTSDLPENKVCAGNPCRIISDRFNMEA